MYILTIIFSGKDKSYSQVKVKVTRAQLCQNDRDPVLFAKGCKSRDKPSLNMASCVGKIRRILRNGQRILNISI